MEIDVSNDVDTDRSPWTKQRLIDLRDRTDDDEIKRGLRKAVEMIELREAKIHEIRFLLKAAQRVIAE